jgi:hypothetical protein
MISLYRLRERAMVRVESTRTTLTSSPLPPKEGEEVIEGGTAQHDVRSKFI